MPARTCLVTVLSQAAYCLLLSAAGGVGVLLDGGQMDNSVGGLAGIPHGRSQASADAPPPIEAHKTSFPGLVSATSPYIDPVTPHRVYAYAGTTAFIPCVVNNLGQRSVSWVRHHDIHVLTVGRFTFTNDDRFEVHHDDGSNEWLLRLRAPSANDTGIYECQINTKPTLTQLIRLEVLEPRAVITAGQELYLDRGSTLRLTCQVVDAPSTSDFLLWYHEQKVANYEVEKVEVSVRVENDTTVSTLTLRDAQVHNSGQYTCSPSNANPTSIRVHVLSGEHPAAMQTNGANTLPGSPSFTWGRVLTALLFSLSPLFLIHHQLSLLSLCATS